MSQDTKRTPLEMLEESLPVLPSVTKDARSPDCQAGASKNPKIRQSQIWAHRARWAWCARWAPGHVALGGTDYGWSLWWKESWRAHGSHAWSNMKQGVKQKQMNWSSIRNPCMSYHVVVPQTSIQLEKSTNRSLYMVILGNILILCILGIFWLQVWCCSHWPKLFVWVGGWLFWWNGMFCS